MKQSREKLNRIMAILLTAVMTLSMSGYALEAVYAEDGEDQTEVTVTQQNEDAHQNENAEKSDGEQQLDAVAQGTEDETGSGTEGGTGNENEGGTNPDPQTPPERGTIVMNAKGEDGRITVLWKPFTSTEYSEIYYKVFLDDNQDGVRVDTCKHVLTDLSGDHKVTVRAYSTRTVPPQTEGAEPTTEEVILAEGILENVSATTRNRLGSHTRGASNLGINLKAMAGESHSGYSVVQGGCTDGTFNYYLMVSTYNQNGRILKTRVGDNAVVGASGVIDIEHGNGMAYDKKNNNLVIIGREGWRNRLTSVDADSLSGVTYREADYNAESGKWQSSSGNGLAAISYVPEYDCFIAQQRGGHDLLVIKNTGSKGDPHYVVCGFIATKIQATYPGTYQAMDADDRYVYLLLSYYSSKQPYNRILVLDWNAENLGIKTDWKCNNNGSGTPDADIILNTPYEAENIYHIDRGDGTADFYLSEYFNNHQTEVRYEQQAYQVKWKKVKKKVPVQKKYKKRVKWMKVQTKNGKWKWKYKKVTKYKTVWKKKKVWLYKTKYKTVKVKDSYFNRDDFVYYLGNF